MSQERNCADVCTAMSALPPKSPATVAPFSDALGYRVLGFDKKSGDRLEMLRLRPQLASSPAFRRMGMIVVSLSSVVAASSFVLASAGVAPGRRW